MYTFSVVVGLLVDIASALPWKSEEKRDVELLKDIKLISKHWGQITPYSDNDENYFGIDYVGLPDGCQVVSLLA